ncbi:Low molecular weight neuronal intermediate filament [Acipenser ruthenus]|uniref:Low molecular weight neuronal intermediate filament n=1 Tax=Acipenser ruthenus TaxID=7906 RepID=A0A444U542_ACIRT|nr:Low molecular weight neuronal intermediate filament [Acipenser ruthenus]
MSRSPERISSYRRHFEDSSSSSASYQVRTLEQQNKILESEIEAIHNRYTKPSGLRLLYEEQLRELKKIAEQMKIQRDMAVAAKEAMAGQLEMIKVKYEEAHEARKKAELEIETLRPDVDAATSARIALEKQLENLEVELEFLQRVHKEKKSDTRDKKLQTVKETKLIEGEDSRLSTTTRSMRIMSGSFGLGRMGHGVGQGLGQGKLGAIESISKEQAVEMTERKTVLIR